MAAIGNTGTSSEVKRQYENMKKFVGGVSYFPLLHLQRQEDGER
jgi:hypothetical protein